MFYYDLGSPECYLLAEQVMTALPVVPEWEPVVGHSPSNTDRSVIERLAGELGLQPLRWPARLPADTRQAMLAATYAKRVGRGVAFSLAAFRQAFAAGRDLSEENTILIAGAACEMHPAALLKGIGLRSVGDALAAARERALADGVSELPAIRVDRTVYCGLAALADAAGALGAARA